jgi:hypothetical protein
VLKKITRFVHHERCIGIFGAALAKQQPGVVQRKQGKIPSGEGEV